MSNSFRRSNWHRTIVRAQRPHDTDADLKRDLSWARPVCTGPSSRDDSGLSLVQVIVAVFVAGIVTLLLVQGYQTFVHGNAESNQRTEVTTGIDDANGQIHRDITDATALRLADTQRLTLTVIRDELCQERAYTADPAAGTLSVTTTFYEQATCSGASESSTKKLLKRYTEDATFTYFGENQGVAIPAPVQELKNVSRIEWDLAAKPYVDKDAPDVTLASGAAYRGGVEQTGGDAVVQGKRPTLKVVTVVAGKDAPVITWTDPTPGVTNYFWVTRAASPEGTLDGAFQNLAIVQPTSKGTQTDYTYTDTSLQPGARATYVVYAVLTDGSSGPSSNSADTGLRPAIVTGVTATGAATSITVTWAATSGATGYDIYRDDVLAGRVTSATATTWTDGPTDATGRAGWGGSGYGHAHKYRVVAVNRWEQVLTTGSESGRVPYGDAITKAYTAANGSAQTRLSTTDSVPAGAFTAPAAPTLTSTPNANWTNTVARTFAGWVGAGPTSKAGVSRDRGWETQTATLSGAFANFWGESAAAAQTHTSRPAGATTRYQARACNASGCGPYSAVSSALQRPPAPASCVTSGASTRGMNVTVNPTAMESGATGYQVTGGSGAPTGTGAQASNVFNVDQLTHSTTHSFASATRNASPANSGWSDATGCSGTTAVLGVSVAGVSSSTRTINATIGLANGSSSSLTLEGVRTDANVNSTSWDPLPDGTAYTVTARNTDGYNNVAAQAGIATQVLTAPGTPSCSISGGGTAPNGSAILSAEGGANASSYQYSPQQARTGLSAGIYSGSCRSVRADGYNYSYSGWNGSGSVAVTAPPVTSDWSTVMPSCSGVSKGQIQSVWLSNYNGTHYTPDWSTMQFKVGTYQSDGSAGSLSWRISANRRDTDFPQMTSGVASCSGGGVGV